MGTKLIYFNTILEKRIVQTLMVYFSRSSLACSLFPACLRAENASCILFAETNLCIPKLIYQRTSGKAPEPEKKMKNWDPQAERMTISTLSEVFRAVYFISFRDTGLFSTITENSTAKIKAAVQNWIDRQENLSINPNHFHPAQAVVKNTGDRVFIWFDNDLIALNAIRETRSAVHVIIPEEGMENVISRVLGSRLISVQTIVGRNLPITRYTDEGKKL